MTELIAQPVLGTNGNVVTGNADTPHEAATDTLETIREMTPEEATESENMNTDKGLCELEIGPSPSECVEIRFWGEKAEFGDDGPNTKIRFEVTITDDFPLFKQFSGISRENIRNGNDYYEVLDDEIADLLTEVFDSNVARDLQLIADPGNIMPDRVTFSGATEFR